MMSKITNNISIGLLSILFSSVMIAAPTTTDIAINITAPLNSPTPTFTPGQSQTNTYSFTVSKTTGSDADVAGIDVTAGFSGATVSGLTWTCTTSGSSRCGNNTTSDTGIGAISESIDLAGTDSVTFTFNNVTIASNVSSNLTFNVDHDGGPSGSNGNNDPTSSNDTDSQLITRALLLISVLL